MINMAIDYLNQAINLNPNYIRAYNNRAAAYRNIEMDDKCQSDRKQIDRILDEDIPQPKLQRPTTEHISIDELERTETIIDIITKQT